MCQWCEFDEDEEDDDEPVVDDDDCMGCGMCEDCVERSRNYADPRRREEMV